MVRPVEYLTPSDLQEIFNINVFGQIAATQGFLPLLRQARRRIVNISPVGAHIAVPFGSLINASKSAFGTFSDTLRLELHPFGIRGLRGRAWSHQNASGEDPRECRSRGRQSTTQRCGTIWGDAEKVRRPCLCAGNEWQHTRCSGGRCPSHPHCTPPRTRYRVGKHASLLTTLPRILPEWLLDAILLRIAGVPTKFGTIVSADERQLQKPAA
jgi:short chain dehydrogenase